MDDQSPSTGPVPEIQNKAPKPPGVSPKNRQTVVMLAVGGLIALVIAFSNSSGPSKPKASPSKARVQEPTPVSPKSVQQYARQLEDDTKNLAQERARAEQMRAEAQRLQAGPQNPYQNPYQPAPGAMSASGERQPSARELQKQAERKREEDSLRASNIALSFRKDQPSSAGDRPAMSSDLSDVRQLIEAQKAALAATLQPQPSQIRSVPDAVTQAATLPSAAHDDNLETSSPGAKGQQDGALQQSIGKNRRVFEGTTIETVLTNRLNGTFSGPVNALVTTAVYSRDGQHVLIPQGTRVIGDVQRVSVAGQQRLAVAFHRMIMPDGYSLNLDQFRALNQIGETGLKDQVNQHYLQIFGTSLALGAIAGVEQARGSYGYNTSGTDVYRQGVAQSLSGSATRILDHFLNVLPTVTIREGHRIKVYLTGDLVLPAYENHRVASDL
ncbi:MAG: putative conjugal transfer protein TrbI family [Bryobacterales bacterium]|nr:putative conjugal transfer protein TrbI family [Bryobacterales bacterium]